MSRVLAIHPGWVRPDFQSGDRRFASILAAVESHFGVDLLMAEVGHDPEAQKLNALRAYFIGRILPDSWRGAEAALLARSYECCVIEFWHAAEKAIPTIRRAAPWAPIIVDSVDVHFAREKAAAELGLMDADEVESRKNRELAAYRAADAVVVVTEEDKRVLRAAGVETPIYLIPNILPIQKRPDLHRRREVLFIGGFNHKPNGDGISWFAHECWARVRAAVPDAHLSVVGSNPTDSVRDLAKLPGIDAVGYVPSTNSYLDRAAVSIAPLRYGAGMKGKVCEALAGGVPLVTTSVGAQGLDLQDGHGARVRDAAEEFADAVIWALSNPEKAEAMGAEGRRIVEAACGVSVVSAQIAQMVQSLARRPTASQLISWRIRSLIFAARALARQLAIACGARALKRLIRSPATEAKPKLPLPDQPAHYV